MPDVESILKDPSLLLIFAYAPAGFGHLRVSDALYHALPAGTNPIILGAQDKSLTFFHRLMSIHPITRSVTEWMERGAIENIFTYWYRLFLRGKTKLLYEQIKTIVDERFESPSTVLVVATHFGLAHQIASLKEKMIKEKKVKVFLAVQVTDDSPHHIWYVDGADIICVPSDSTKKELERYGHEKNLPKVCFETIAYPLSPALEEELSEQQIEERVIQVQKARKVTINVIIPISGAAVGLSFFSTIVDELYKLSHRFLFHIIVKNVSYTRRFISKMSNFSCVSLIIAAKDRDVVDRYEELYRKESIAIEITKPSEQAFKALLDCTKRGASLLLFSEPVGRQEKDNLYFLKRHHLTPSDSDARKLFTLAKENAHLAKEHEGVLKNAALWRGMSIPKNAKDAARFIWWCLAQGIFSRMMTCKVHLRSNDPHLRELMPNGATLFWEKVCEVLKKSS